MTIETLGLMQPYFFPYLGYFDLINYSDQWIVFDVVQYIRRGWMNRNRIHHPKEGYHYIVVPLKKHTQKVLIKDVVISDDPKWKAKILGQLNHYRKKAPYFKEAYSIAEDCLSINEKSLSRFNTIVLGKICSILGINFKYDYFSEMNLEIDEIYEPGDRALKISEKLRAREYVNPSGGLAIYDPKKFKSAGIKLTIRNIPPFEYPCRGYEYIPYLSIIDVMMFNSPEEIKKFLDVQKAANNKTV